MSTVKHICTQLYHIQAPTQQHDIHLQNGVLPLTSAYRFLKIPEGLHSHEPFAQLVQRARSRLQAEFDDLDAVWASESLMDEFLKMPLEALLVCTLLFI